MWRIIAGKHGIDNQDPALGFRTGAVLTIPQVNLVGPALSDDCRLLSQNVRRSGYTKAKGRQPQLCPVSERSNFRLL